MDRNTIIAFVLIGIILMVWMSLNAPKQQKPSAQKSDSTLVQSPAHDTAHAIKTDSLKVSLSSDTLGKFFTPLSSGENKTLLIHTDLYNAKLSSKGGAILAWELTKFKTWDGYPVNLIDEKKGGDFHLLFSTSDGRLVNTKDLFFTTTLSPWSQSTLTNEDSTTITFVLPVNEKSKIYKSFTFYNKRYDVSVSYKFEGMENIISNFEYQASWETGLRYQEHNSIDESGFAHAATYSGGEITEVDATSSTETYQQSISGQITWAGCRNKYFAMAMIPRVGESQGAFLEGHHLQLPDHGTKEDYLVSLKMQFLGREVENSRFTLYLGPLDFDIVTSYNVHLDRMMSLGAAWIIRPISEYVIIPTFRFLKLIIPNYGFILIVFSLLIKIALHPLTKSSMTSMKKMQALQPQMAEIKEKYKDDPQKMNMQTMRLYKEYGVNPAGGCLPMLLQLPILYALWAVFRSTIELRQAAFIFWIHDLSIPDVITKLPFKIPIFGIDQLSGLALLLGIVMFVQQKMSVQDPRQKMMVWLMPIMMTFLFMSFPSGLNLYYLMFNLLSVVQQWYINKHHDNQPLQKVDLSKQKPGFFERLAKSLPEQKR